ncbi:hypothetical protein MMC17_006891 [Xylographa soralifera]|nr:hypothetical protein [Xylographa soralifera]MCJ1383777.1 hypothetical protein [Xylographa soralifera]
MSSKPRNDSLLARQPYKTIWVFFAMLSIAIRLPIWMLYYVPRNLRPVPSWTYRQAFMTQLIKSVVYHVGTIRLSPPLSLAPGAEGDRFVLIRPSKEAIYVGVLKDPEIMPAVIGGTWFPAQPIQEGIPKTVILHFHGGAYAMNQGREKDSGYMAKLLLNHVAPRVFMPQYRLGSHIGGRFPAALQDAVSSYKHLLELGVPASSIIVSGDSAGGNIVITLLRYLSEHKGLLPSPSAGLLWSPWIDVCNCLEYGLPERNRNYKTDYLTSPLTWWGTIGFLPDSTKTAGEYLSSPSKPFTTDTPLWISTGGAEVLRDDDVEFASSMSKMKGNKVDFHEEPFVPHDIMLAGNILGFETEAENMAKKAGEFLKTLQ